MPRDLAGNMTLVPAVAGILPNTTILDSQVKLPLEDIAQEITNSLPVDGRKAMSGDLTFATGKTAKLGKAGVGNEPVRAQDMPFLTPAPFASIGAMLDAADISGQAIWLPPGVYDITASRVHNLNVSVHGAGRKKTTIRFTQTTGDMMVLRSNLGSLFCDLTIQGPSLAGNPTSTNGSLITVQPLSGIGAGGCDFRSVDFLYGYNQINHASAYGSDFNGCNFTSFVNAGLLLNNVLLISLGRNKIRGCTFTGVSIAAGFGIYHTGGPDLMMSDCQFLSVAFGYVAALQPAQSLYNIQISNCIFSNLPYCIRFIKGTGLQLFNIGISNCHLQGNQILTDDGGTNWNGDISITGNQFFPNDGGVAISLNSNALAGAGNVIDGGSFTGTTGIIVGAGAFNWTLGCNSITSVDTILVNNAPSEATIRIMANGEHLEGIGPPSYPITIETPTASPWIISAGARRKRIYARSGAVTDIAKRPNYGSASFETIGTGLSATFPLEVTLEPHEDIRFTFPPGSQPYVQSQELP